MELTELLWGLDGELTACTQLFQLLSRDSADSHSGRADLVRRFHAKLC
jgi:hypothetical protein